MFQGHLGGAMEGAAGSLLSRDPDFRQPQFRSGYPPLHSFVLLPLFSTTRSTPTCTDTHKHYTVVYTAGTTRKRCSTCTCGCAVLFRAPSAHALVAVTAETCPAKLRGHTVPSHTSVSAACRLRISFFSLPVSFPGVLWCYTPPCTHLPDLARTH